MRRVTSAALLGIVVLVTGCLGEGGDSGEGDSAGGEVTVLGIWEGEEADRFRAVLDAFTEETGVEVAYEGTRDAETIAVARVEGGNPPDIGFLPPGLMRSLAERDAIRSLEDVVDRAALEEMLVPGTLEAGTVDDELIGIPFRVSVKSLVWHPVPELADAGYEEPATWDEMLAVSEEIRAAGTPPWCLGIGSGASTGWPVTDWIEDILLRTAGPEAYDRWVAGELPFSSPEVTQAAELFAEIAFTEGNVLGGRSTIPTQQFGDAPLPLFDDPPGCYLHRQASFITEFFPEDAVLGEDVDFFYLPPIPAVGEYDGSPVLGAGDYASLFTDNQGAEQLIQFLATPEAGEPWAADGGFLSPHATFDASVYPEELSVEQAEILSGADAFRFDASDLMPPEVGVGTFWTEMVAWVNGEKELEDALQAIDESWPTSG